MIFFGFTSAPGLPFHLGWKRKLIFSEYEMVFKQRATESALVRDVAWKLKAKAALLRVVS